MTDNKTAIVKTERKNWQSYIHDLRFIQPAGYRYFTIVFQGNVHKIQQAFLLIMIMDKQIFVWYKYIKFKQRVIPRKR